MALLAGVLLSACGVSFSNDPGGPAWHRGYHAGKAARSHHKFGHRATSYDVTAFCAQRAFGDIQTMKSAVLEWTEGFEKGCLRS